VAGTSSATASRSAGAASRIVTPGAGQFQPLTSVLSVMPAAGSPPIPIDDDSGRYLPPAVWDAAGNGGGRGVPARSSPDDRWPRATGRGLSPVLDELRTYLGGVPDPRTTEVKQTGAEPTRAQ
jgi:hypothetical protein